MAEEPEYMKENPLHMINFNREKLNKLKKAYAACKDETFVFEGQHLLKGYAKYMIQYLEGIFKGELCLDCGVTLSTDWEKEDKRCAQCE